jgi:CHAT domain-containing protein
MGTLLKEFQSATEAIRKQPRGIRLRSNEEEEESEIDMNVDEGLDFFDTLPDRLGEIFFAPWLPRLKELHPTELILSPNDALNLLPLHGARWDGKVVIERWPVCYLPSPALVKNLLQIQRRELGEEALVVGNPTKDLPFAEREAQSVADMLGVEPLVREEAQANTFIKRSKASWIAHLATHTRFDREDPLKSYITFSDRGFSLFEIISEPNLDLSGSSLLYLSSCDSAVSLPGKSDELIGLLRGLMYAGAPTIIASLWPVDDEAAYCVALRFYSNWQKRKMSKREAFQQAIVALMRGESLQELGMEEEWYSHKQDPPSNPYFWAPFLMMGMP